MVQSSVFASSEIRMEIRVDVRMNVRVDVRPPSGAASNPRRPGGGRGTPRWPRPC